MTQTYRQRLMRRMGTKIEQVPLGEFLAETMVGFMDTHTEEKNAKYLEDSVVYVEAEDLHTSYMEHPTENLDFWINRMKRMSQLVGLAYIESKHPELFKALLKQAEELRRRYLSEPKKVEPIRGNPK